MDERIERLLEAYDERIEAEESRKRELVVGGDNSQRDALLLAVGRDTGRLLNALVKGAGATRILELGTSYGYSTVWLAEAVRETGGTVVSIETHPGKRDYALEQLTGVDLDSVVDLRLGDAVELLQMLDGPFDFVLLDLWKELYVPCFDLMLPRLAEDALIVADNMILPEIFHEDAAAYRRHVRATGRFDSILLPIDEGLEISRFLG
jgi:predicted O-methyltransferase YrrM